MQNREFRISNESLEHHSTSINDEEHTNEIYLILEQETI